MKATTAARLEELRPALQHGGGGGGGRAAVSPALAAVTGAAVQPRPQSQARSGLGRRSMLLAPRFPAGHVPNLFHPPRAEWASKALANPVAEEARGRCRQGEGKKRKTWRIKENF